MPRLKAKILGLSDWGLSPSSLRRLGNRLVKVMIQQKSPELRHLFPLAPRMRQAKLKELLARGLRTLQRRYPGTAFEVRGDNGLAWGIDAELPAEDLVPLSELANVDHVSITQVPGLRRRRATTSKSGWFAVRGLVAIQIEGQAGGHQTVEDRVVLVRAQSAEHAKRRLKSEWNAYAQPYLNPNGLMVRWQLDHVVDVYAIWDDKIDEDGTEVYSRLRQRKMRRENEWHPRGRRGRRLTSA